MSVVNLADVRAQRRKEAVARDAAAKPEWGDDIQMVAAYARMVRAEHEAESCRINFDRQLFGIAWWQSSDAIKERVRENNCRWDDYVAVCAHLASLPASMRSEARAKRNTIGKIWLRPDSTARSAFGKMRAGCLADDHLFPPSLKLARLKGR